MIRILTFAVALAISFPIAADADGPDTLKVTKLRDGSMLNVRRGPSVRFGVVGLLSHDAKDIENLGCSPDFSISDWERFTELERFAAAELRWCRIAHEGLLGWAAARYLEED